MPRSAKVLQSLIHDRFPKVQFACGYGSGILKQGDGSIKGKMIDVLLVVSNSQDWHKENLKENPVDYAFIPRYIMTPATITGVQRGFGGKYWFNPYAKVEIEREQTLMKYGVIAYDDFIDDLEHWTNFYSAGRLQKPVLELIEDERVSSAVTNNRRGALALALLILSQDKNNTFTTTQVYETVAGLSYTGDVRMGFAESPTKIVDIVKGAYPEFHGIYSDMLSEFIKPLSEGDSNTDPLFTVQKDSLELLRYLPGNFSNKQDLDAVEKQLSSVIKMTSLSQTLKGLLSAGVMKSLWYSLAKLQKRLA